MHAVCDDAEERARAALHGEVELPGGTVDGVELVAPAAEDAESRSGAPGGEGCLDVGGALLDRGPGEGDGGAGEGPVRAREGVFERLDDGGEEVPEGVGAVGEEGEGGEALGVEGGVGGGAGEAVGGVSECGEEEDGGPCLSTWLMRSRLENRFGAAIVGSVKIFTVIDRGGGGVSV